MKAATYNGWTNYETWAVNLWLDNEKDSHDAWRMTARERWDESRATNIFTRREVAQQTLAEILKENIEDDSPLNDEPSLYSDLLNAALSEVNWDEIAGALLDACELD